MMIDYSYAFIVILVMGLVTMATRLLPVMVFDRNKVPDIILYFGNVVPYTAMGLLIVYCLKDTSPLSSNHMIPEIIALAVVSLSYLWKRNTIFSVLIGTILYMVLVQVVF